jgi:WD40 repeat protein
VLTGSMDKRLLLWDTRSSWCAEWRPSSPVAFAGFEPQGGTVWSVSDAGLVQRWVADRSEPVNTVDLAAELEPGERVWTAAASRQRRSTLVGTSRGRILEFAAAGAVAVVRAAAHAGDSREGSPQAIQFLLPSREQLLFNVGFRSMVLRSATGEQVLPVPRSMSETEGEFDEALASMAWAPDGTGFAVGTDAEHVWRFDARGQRQADPGSALGSSVQGLAWDPSSQRLFAATRDGALFRLDHGGATRLADLGVFITRFAATADAEWLAAGCGDRRVRILDRNGRLHLTLPPLRDGIRSLEFSPDGRLLLVASEDGDLRVWPLDLAGSGREILARSPYQAALEEARDRAR